MQNIFSFVLLLFFVSCSHMRSGQHVYWNKKEKLADVARKNNLSLEEIKNLNQGARPGTWLFIPNRIGWMKFFNETTVEEDYSQLGTEEFAWPVPGIKKVSSNFGSRWGRRHDGIDIAGPIGSKIVAVAPGVVKYSDNKISGYGNMIIIQHKADMFSVYAHNQKNKVSQGDRVRRGEHIANLGNTGRSTGPHLHFEVRIKNKARNPANYIKHAGRL